MPRPRKQRRRDIIAQGYRQARDRSAAEGDRLLRTAQNPTCGYCGVTFDPEIEEHDQPGYDDHWPDRRGQPRPEWWFLPMALPPT
jgi:hypothetical protein